MRKPLLLICLVCCLLLVGSTSLSAAANRQDTSDVSTAGWTVSSWFSARLPGLILLLPEPMQTNIFVDGPDPVESSQPKEDDAPNESPEDDDNTAGPTPFDSGGSGNISGSRD